MLPSANRSVSSLAFCKLGSRLQNGRVKFVDLQVILNSSWLSNE